jgi:hypothetical protein
MAVITTLPSRTARRTQGRNKSLAAQDSGLVTEDYENYKEKGRARKHALLASDLHLVLPQPIHINYSDDTTSV